MNLLKIHHKHPFFRISKSTHHHRFPFRPQFVSLLHEFHFNFRRNSLSSPAFTSSVSPFSISKFCFKVYRPRASSIRINEEEEGDGTSPELEDLGPDSAVYKKTLRLVECAMLAAISGLVYVLSNSLGIENYFGCFFSLPIVVSSMRWGVAAGRKTMVATAVLLLVLSGPLKALTYLLTHGLVGFTMGSLWRLGANWGLSIFLCTIVRSVGALGYVLISSFLIRENILALITINIHASITFMFTACGLNIIPSMDVIYSIFGILLFLNSGFFVFLLHLLYSVFLTGLGMRSSLKLPRWLEKAI